MNIVFLSASNVAAHGLTGGESILINLFREWRHFPGATVTMLTTNLEKEIARQNGVEDDRIMDVLTCRDFEGVFRRYIYRTWFLMWDRRTHEILRNADVVYSASDFWQDSLTAFYFKLKYPRLRWIAGFYLFAPAPLSQESPYRGRHFLRGLFYYLTQRPVYWIIRRVADAVYVTSDPDVKRFAPKPVVVVRGGVDTTASEAYLSGSNVIPVAQRKYDAVFMGRLHYQKGVLLLVDIWREVVRQRPGAKLAVIGHGSLDVEMRAKMREFGLESNIEMLGFLSGTPKYEIFKQSKVVLHPATYDSGGMAAAEAMAWGLPGVSFDLEALRTYYPKGMVKVSRTGDMEGFAREVLSLLGDEQRYGKLRGEALSLVREMWEWKRRSKAVWEETSLCFRRLDGERETGPAGGV